MEIIETAMKQGIKIKRICSLLQIEVRRVLRWRKRADRLKDHRPGPKQAPHRLLKEEKEAIMQLAKREEYADDSHRVLAAKGADLKLFYASASTVYRVMNEKGLTTDRTCRIYNNRKSIAPERPEITGSNQRWCWDITYCYTPVKGAFLYLFVLLDEYSRKVIAWRISWHMNHKEAMELIQEGLENEGLDDINVKLPDLINDRGTQMKAKAFMKLCKDLGIKQEFSRPRTPNDNPFIESFFSIVKGYSAFPELFTDDIEAITYFTTFFDFYNNQRYHGEIGYVTPKQRHNGLDKKIIERRKKGLVNARIQRLIKNKSALIEGKVDFQLVVA